MRMTRFRHLGSEPAVTAEFTYIQNNLIYTRQTYPSFESGTSTTPSFGSFKPTTGTNAFGAPPAFGATATPQPTTTTTGGAFGQQQAPTGTGHVKYNPVVGTDMVVKSGTSQNVNIKHHCITCMKEYEGKSLEELRLEDYTAGRKGASAGMFSSFQQPTENKPLFGGSTFGQPATTSAPLFGGGSLGSTGFGQTNTFAFGGNTPNQTTSTGLFGNKPAFGATSTTGTGIFGASTTQAPTFGTTTPSFGAFGSTTQNQVSINN
ncbi:Nuclear pore complex protein Nup98-Nup96 [Papilio machaon]|uniref:Nuclear pore complex protein Nup98-Nup96 n=1 Tax=Papilio machaon TaxID=76193 RepID=A0A0N1PHS5_PAPMA|nr:Nuclear pore complex protein Nup98-Nup96 [Papilio machaon]